MAFNLVTLTEEEMREAAFVGVNRNISSLLASKSAGFKQENLWSRHVEGACGECALAKWLGVKWEATVDTYKFGGDVLNIQIRTRSHDRYDLNVQPGDEPHFDDPFVLLTGRAPAFSVVGWIYGREASDLGVFEDRGDYGRPCWWVPQASLRPMDTLCSAIIRSKP